MDKIKRNYLISEIFISYILENNKARAVEYIRQLDAEGRRDLRAACQRLDNLVEDTWIEELRDKRIAERIKSIL
jgi:hypothetical protein